CLRNALAFFKLRSISYSVLSNANRTVSPAGPPSRSSSSATVIFVAISASLAALDLLYGKDTVNVQDPTVIALGTNHLAQTVALVCLSGRSATPERFGAGPDVGCGHLMPGPNGGSAVDRRVREHLAGAGRAVKADVHGALVAAPPHGGDIELFAGVR